MTYKPRILLPSTEQEFETLCTHVYGDVFNCMTPAIYGRRGQKQYGLDVLIYKDNLNQSSNRIGIQCKHVSKLPFDGNDSVTIVKEIAKADSGKQQITKLIIATSLPSDQKLTDAVNTLSDERASVGKFTVEIQFWNDIENHITHSSVLSKRYHSNSDYLGKIKQSKEFFDKEKYSAAIEALEIDDINLMNHIERYETYYILANCYHLIEQNDKFTYYASKLKDFGWNDEKYNVLRILEYIIDSNAESALRFVESCIDEYPDNIQYQAFKYILEINKNKFTDFWSLPEPLRKLYSVKSAYMRYYSHHIQFDKYDAIEELINKDERLKPTFIILHLETTILKYSTTKINHYYIQNSLNLLELNLNINKIDVPSLKKYALNSIITANCIINNEESVKHYYRLTKTTKCGVLPETIINLVSFTKRNSDKDFFLIVYKDCFSTEIVKYLIDGLYNFGEIDELNNLTKSHNTLEKPLINEIKSFLAVNQLNDNEFSDFISEEAELLSINTFRGLALLGLKLHSTGDKRFEELNKNISSITNLDSNLKTSLADYYFKTKQYKSASEVLDSLIDDDTEEYLLIIQLESLFNSLQYQKAKHFIDKNINNFDKYLASFASLVNKLDYITNDFSSTEKLLPKLDRFANTSWYWRLKLFLSEHNRDFGQLKKDINLIPLNLDNDPINTCWIASYEIQYFNQKRAVERVVNLWRSNPSNLSILTSIQDLLQSFLIPSKYSKIFNHQGNLFFDNPPTKVIDGCYVSYIQEADSKYIFIDSKANFESSSTVTSPNTDLGKQFLNKSVGDTFYLGGNFGIKRKVEVKEISSIPLGIFRSNSELAADANSPFNMVSFSIDLETDEDMSKFLNDMKQCTGSEEQLEKLLTIYQTNPVTIQYLAEFIGRDITDIIYSWVGDSRFPLRTIDPQYTIDMNADEVKKSLLKEPKVVIDLFTLLELKRLDSLHLITNNVSLYVPLSLLSELKLLYEKHVFNYRGGKAPMTLRSVGNKVSLVPMATDLLQKRSDDLEFLIDYVEGYVHTPPAYGDNSNSKIVEVINEFLPESDKSIIRLCQETNLPLLSLDARLRALNHQAGAQSIDFYDYLDFLKTVINDNEIKKFNTIQFVSNRNCKDFSFSSIATFALKDNTSLNLVVNKLLNHISLTFDVNSGIKVLDFFITELANKRTHPTNDFISKLTNIYFCYLYNFKKLDFENHKKLINDYFHKRQLQPPMKLVNVDSLKYIRENTLCIIYGTAQPWLCTKD